MGLVVLNLVFNLSPLSLGLLIPWVKNLDRLIPIVFFIDTTKYAWA